MQLFVHCASKKLDSVLLPVTLPKPFIFRLTRKFVKKSHISVPHHILNVSLYYPVKYLCSKIAMLKE